MRKVMSLPDLHFPNYDVLALNASEKFMPHFKPDYLFYLGDALDLNYLSSFDKHSPRKLEGKRLKWDYKELNKVIKRHKKLCGNPKVIYFIGNHEYRLERYLDEHPQGEGFQEIEQNLEGIDEFIPYNKTYNIGKLYYLHGMYVNQYHARKTVDAYKRNVIYGHTHSVQVHTSVSPIDRQDYHTGKSIGTLSDKNPDYMHNRPNAWVNGFHIAYVMNDGFFSDYQIVINKGRFVWDGKVYQGKV